MTFLPIPHGRWVVCGQYVCYHVAAFVIPFNLIYNMTRFWKKNEFWPFDSTPRVRGVCGQNIYYHVGACVIPFNLICNMTEFWKSWILTPPPRSRGGGGAGKIFATTLLHASFPLIWYATWPKSKKIESGPLPHPLSSPRGSNPGRRSQTTFDMFHMYCTLSACEISVKILTTDWVIAKF